MRENLDKHGDKFAQRILTATELSEFEDKNDKAAFLAKRFAAKEAVAKALGTGFSSGIGMKMICIGHDDAGRPLVELSQQAKERADQMGVDASWLSISDEKRYATAFVVMEKLG